MATRLSYLSEERAGRVLKLSAESRPCFEWTYRIDLGWRFGLVTDNRLLATALLCNASALSPATASFRFSCSTQPERRDMKLSWSRSKRKLLRRSNPTVRL